ncbi:MAG TPA: nickel pincer cofactor biosynthesis protein LarC [Roseiflexaceae bacterium]|nr:nickel pincer cofactor biosynthesis protein LarC [Roseiflexaceae bacterium]
MTRVIYFDCFSGISGDMALGALLDAGLDLQQLREALGALAIDGWAIDAERGMRRFLSGTQARVAAPTLDAHRHLADVQAIIGNSWLPPHVRERSIRVFDLLAHAEAQVHGMPVDEVHFHEVGALDAIVDIVGVVSGLDLLGISECYASALPLGTGWVRAAHGRIPVPAPATLNLLAAAGAPILADETRAELVTPTGAALLAALATFRRPAMRIERVGYGLGSRDLDHPNALRVWIGVHDPAERPDVAADRSGSGSIVVLLETNIDDQSAEQLAYANEQLFALGALDVWATPIQMKKGRSAILLSILIPAAIEAAAVSLLMRETTTLGIRRRTIERYVAEREILTISTPLGSVRYKRKRWNGVDLGGAPEYEDCAALARSHGIPLREVYHMVHAAVAAQEAGPPTGSWLLSGHHPS